MSIRQSLLAILELGPCYGYQLRAEFERRTGGARPLNVGQVYTTLDRLERDGLATKAAPDAAGHSYYTITPAGSTDVRAWLGAPTDDDLPLKVALAITLPGADVAALLSAQRAATTDLLAHHRATPRDTPPERLLADARLFAAEAELRWLAAAEVLVVGAIPYGLELVPPKRGRPTRANDKLVIPGIRRS
jgi:DNA-binding PadR family transcriptional regulator